MIQVHEHDLLRLYAKLNAHEVILRALLSAIVEGDAARFEEWRSAVMEQGDLLRRAKDDPNPDFVDAGRVETLAALALTLEAVKPKSGDGAA
jgi:hypothetical protein